jgi:hypothetical protein
MAGSGAAVAAAWAAVRHRLAGETGWLKFGPAPRPKSTALRCAANMPRPDPPLGTKRIAASLSAFGLSGKSAPRAAGAMTIAFQRSATCVDFSLNNRACRQSYPQIDPQLSVARSYSPVARARHSRQPSRQGDGAEARARRRAHPAAGARFRAGPRGSVEQGDPRGRARRFCRGPARANRPTGAPRFTRGGSCPRSGFALRRRPPRWDGASSRGPCTASPRSARVGAAVHQGRREASGSAARLRQGAAFRARARNDGAQGASAAAAAVLLDPATGSAADQP